MPDALIGKKIGQYEIESVLGQGGMAIVYRAHQSGMNRDVAMKVVSPSLSADSNFQERFDREVKVISALEHSHIVPVHDHGITTEGLTYLTMRLLKGGSLGESMRANGPLPLPAVNLILTQIADALDYAHNQNIIHRDLKPNNILLDEYRNAYLVDFGLARMLDTDGRLAQNLTETGVLLGTPSYMSPEQVETGHADTRSDIYSMGVILYEMLAGRPPFVTESTFKLMQAHLVETPPPIREFRPDLPEAAEHVISKLLAKKPEERYQSIRAAAQDFDAAVQGKLSTQPLVPLAPQHTPSGAFNRATTTLTTLRQPRVSLFAVGAGILVVLLAGAFFTLVMRANNTNQAVTFAPEDQRPAVGQIVDSVPTDAQIRIVKDRLQGSFIGIMACSLSSEYHASLVRGARTRAEGLGIPVKVEDAQTDAFRQSGIIEGFIAQGAKAIFVCPIDEKTVTPAIKAAQAAGIVVAITSDNIFGDHSVSLTVTNQQMGQAVGQYTADLINKKMNGHANVAILDYTPAPATVIRADAMQEALKGAAPDATVLGRWQGGIADIGEKNMTEALKQYPDINVIMSINDAGSFGAVKALQAAGKKPDEVAIISVDAETQARQMIADGQYFRASFDTDPVLAGTAAIDASIKLLAGAIIPKQILLPGQMITRELLSQTPTSAAN